jgi:VanZ family protein
MASMRATTWLPPLPWMGLILLLSSDAGSAEHTGALLRPVLEALWPTAGPAQIQALHALIRKAAHFTEYGVLAGLWYRSFRIGWGVRPALAGVYALAVGAGWAVVDEGVQTFVSSRTASPVDVAIDAAGAATASAIAATGWRAADILTQLLLWVATLGGTAVLALHLVLGVGSGWLWLTTPAAAVVLVLVRRATPSIVDRAYRAGHPRRG